MEGGVMISDSFFGDMCACAASFPDPGLFPPQELHEESLLRETKKRPFWSFTYTILQRNIHIRLHNILYI